MCMCVCGEGIREEGMCECWGRVCVWGGGCVCGGVVKYGIGTIM